MKHFNLKKIEVNVGFVTLLAATLLTLSCTEEVMNPSAQVEISGYTPVTVHVTDFSVSVGDFPTRTDPVAATDYTGVKAMTLAFYDSEGTEAYKTTQVKGSLGEGVTFGNFSLSLPLGSYTMVVLGYGYESGDALTLTSPTEAAYTGDHTRETFTTTQPVTISSTAAVNLSATLNRIIAKLRVVSTDGRTAGATNICMTLSAGGKAFNPTSGLATSNTGFSHTVGISKAVGETTTGVTYAFLATDQQTMDVTIETLDASGNTIFSKVVSDVTFQRNRVTTLTGAMYTNSSMSGVFTLSTDWLPDTSFNF